MDFVASHIVDWLIEITGTADPVYGLGDGGVVFAVMEGLC